MYEKEVEQLQNIIDDSKRIVFFGGAGVSTESNIPDFRSADGLYQQKYKYSPEQIVSHSFFVRNPEGFYEFYKEKMMFLDAKPNAAHLKLAELEEAGKLTAVITQNIDGLHQAAGSKNVLELHGSIHRNYCMKCHKFYDAAYVKNASGIPRCTCGGMIKPDVVLYEEGLDPEVKEAILAAAKVLEEKGAIVEEFDLSLVEYAIPAYYVIACAEASSNLARFDGVKYGYRAKDYEGLHNMYKKTRSEGFGAEVKRRIMLGSFVLSSGYYDAYYLKALRTKALIKKAFDKAFAKYDVILGPAAPNTAPKIGDSLSNPLKMYLGDIYTISVNLAGLPGMSVPCGRDAKGLPIGLQLIGDCFKEKNIIRAAYAYEQTRKYEAPKLAKTVEGEAK